MMLMRMQVILRIGVDVQDFLYLVIVQLIYPMKSALLLKRLINKMDLQSFHKLGVRSYSAKYGTGLDYTQFKQCSLTKLKKTKIIL